MEKIKVEIFDEGANYACGWGYEGFGAVICTDKSIKNLRLKFERTLAKQISDMVADGDPIPQWLAAGNYKIEYSLHD